MHFHFALESRYSLRGRTAVVASVVGVLWLTQVAAQTPPAVAQAIASSKQVRQAAAAMHPPQLADPHAGWGAYAGAPDSAQYSSLAQVNRSNVTRLAVAWTYPSGDTTYTSGPIVVDGVLYTLANEAIVALDGATGKEIWSAAGMAHRARGLVYWQSADGSDRRILFPKDNSLVALDARTGKQIMTFGSKGRVDLRAGLGRDPASIKLDIASATPGRVFQNLMILGSATGERYGSPPGDIRAYDIPTGKLVWTFHTIPHPGEFGYHTWPKGAWKTSGGANCWGEMTLDEKRGILFVPTGSPDYNFYGLDRKGANLFANTLLALDARTGKRLWHFQTIHHDLWDYNLNMAPKLLTLRREGKLIEAVAVTGKTSFIYVFDRVTGRPLFPIVERPVPRSDVPGEHASPTQPIPTAPPPFARMRFTENDLSPLLEPDERQALVARLRAARNEGIYTPPTIDREFVMMPGNDGGGQFGNGVADASHGLFFVVSIELPTMIKLKPWVAVSDPHFATAAQRTYAEKCAGCHGLRAQGQPPLIPSLSRVADRLTADNFYKTINHGRGRMPAWPDITQQQAEELRNYLSLIGTADEPAMPAISTERNPEQGDDANRGHYYGDHSGDLVLSKAGFPAETSPWSTLAAYDLNRGVILWHVPLGEVPEFAARGVHNSGLLSSAASIVGTAGGLLFTATNDRKVRAWDQSNGEILWQADLPAASRAIPAVYAVNGRQYLVVAATHAFNRTLDNSTGHDTWSETKPAGTTFAYVAYALPEAELAISH
jgi:quinoprotein glucose dehydrogenase